MLAALRSRFGERVRVTELVIYPDRASIELQDPAMPENLDDWDWSAQEGLHDPRPVHTSKSDPFEPRLFGLGEVRWDLFPHLARTALERLAIPDAEMSHAIASRSRSDRAIVIRLYVSGPRRSGYLEAAADGTILEVEQS